MTQSAILIYLMKITELEAEPAVVKNTFKEGEWSASIETLPKIS